LTNPSDRISVQKQLARGVAVNLSGKVFGRSAFVVGQILLARALGPNLFGVYGIGWNILRIASIISAIGVDSGLVHFAAHYWEKDKRKYSSHVIAAILIVVLLSSLIAVLIWSFSGLISGFFNKSQLENILPWFVISLPALSGAKVIASATRASKDMKSANLIEEVIQPSANIVLIVLAVLLGSHLAGYVIAASASIIIGFCAGLIILFTGYLVKTVSWTEVISQLRPLVAYSLPVAIPTLFGSLVILSDRMFVGYYLPEYETGVYQSVSLISVLFVALLSAYKTMVAPMIASYFHAGSMDDLRRIMRASTRWAAYMGFPIMLVFIVVPDAFLEVFFGPEYLLGTQALVVLTISQLINIGKGPIDQLLIMTGRQKIWFKITILAFGLNIMANWFFIPRIGLSGAAVANVITFLTMTIGGLVVSKLEFGFLPYDGYWVRGFLIFCVLGVVLAIIETNLQITVFWKLAVISLISFGLYIGALYFLGLDGDDRALIENLKASILPNKP
jgi:O-antigen/teichoic acid export membrane protein